MDGVLDELKKAQDAVHVELLATKDAWLDYWGVWDGTGRIWKKELFEEETFVGCLKLQAIENTVFRG